MSAWKPPERVWVRRGVYTGTLEATRHEYYRDCYAYIPESVALERERVLREAALSAVAALSQKKVHPADISLAVQNLRAALDCQGGES